MVQNLRPADASDRKAACGNDRLRREAWGVGRTGKTCFGMRYRYFLGMKRYASESGGVIGWDRKDMLRRVIKIITGWQ